MDTRKRVDIDFEDLIWKIIMDWRKGIAFAIIFAIIFSIGGYVKQKGSYSNYLDYLSNKEATISEKSLKEILSSSEIEAVVSASNVVEKYNQRVNYFENSLLMHIDYYNTQKLNVQYNVLSDKITLMVDELKLYIASGALAKDLKSSLNIQDDVQYIQELITVSSTTSIVQITFIHDDEEMLNDILNSTNVLMTQYVNKLANELGTDSSVSLAAYEISNYVDTNVFNLQQAAVDGIESARTKMVSLTQNYNAQQRQLLDLLGAGKTLDEALMSTSKVTNNSVEAIEPIEPVDKPGYQILDSIIGIIVGLILFVLYNISKYFFTITLQSERELSMQYKIRNLGNITVEKKEISSSRIDRFLTKLRTKTMVMQNKEDQEDYVVENILAYCTRKGIDKICINGHREEVQGVIEGIVKKVEQKGIKCILIDSVKTEAYAISSVLECGNVVFVEQIGVTMTELAKEEIEFAILNEIDIIGYVCVA